MPALIGYSHLSEVKSTRKSSSARANEPTKYPGIEIPGSCQRSFTESKTWLSNPAPGTTPLKTHRPNRTGQRSRRTRFGWTIQIHQHSSRNLSTRLRDASAIGRSRTVVSGRAGSGLVILAWSASTNAQAHQIKRPSALVLGRSATGSTGMSPIKQPGELTLWGQEWESAEVTLRLIRHFTRRSLEAGLIGFGALRECRAGSVVLVVDLEP